MSTGIRDDRLTAETSAASTTLDDYLRKEELWDLLVVGGGTAGLVGAKTAASLGARVLLVERDRMGGDCLWTGCVPSKALLAAAASAAAARGGGHFGVRAREVTVDFATVMGHVRQAIDTIAPVDSAEAVEAAGVVVVHGDLTFTGPTEASIALGSASGSPRTVRFRQAMVATGSRPAVPQLPGIAEVRFLTSDSVWDLEQLPGRLTVLGGGSIGCELGQAFSRLGARVTIVEERARVLPGEDPVASNLLRAALEDDGVTVLTGSSVTSVYAGGPNPWAGVVRLADGRSVEHDQLLVAVGRRPRTDGLALDKAGVGLDARGYVRVDDRLRTTNSRIWAAGDVTGHPQFTHLAGVHGSLAATNAILGLRRSVASETVPRVTFTHPEVASAGIASSDPGEGMRVLSWPDRDVDRAVAEGDTAGVTRLVVNVRGRLVGATIVGPRAGENLAEVVLAIDQKLKPQDLAGSIHAYPTYSDGVWNAAIADVRETLSSPWVTRATSVLAGARRRWLDWRLRPPVG